VVTVVKTDPSARHKGISLLAIERGMKGFERGRNLDKIGQKSADTAELSFTDICVPVENLIGEENRGFYHLMQNLPAERLGIAIHAVGQARRALDLTSDYAHDRTAFGQPIGTFQVNRHAIAEMTVKLDVMQVYVDRCIEAINAGELTPQDAAGAKYWATETQWEIMDRCLQMYGGYGYMNEFEIARLWRDARVQRLYGGTNEIMKDLIGRSLGF
jgi:alkylation response protein AidB-like acyl-CoA dehydrogenase